MYNPSKDLTEIQRVLIYDNKLIDLMGLSNATLAEKSKRIIRRSKFSDLATDEIRLCIFFIPARKTRNVVVHEEIVQIDCHAPYLYDEKVYNIQARIYELLQRKKVNKRCLEFDGQLGELSTADGFFCAGSRYQFYRIV